MTLGLFLTAFTLGLRHGVDWDHIAAISDLSGSADSRRHGFVLSFLYAVGHAAVVFALGSLAILFGLALPGGIAGWMGRLVGFTLVVLGAWVLIGLARKRREFRLQSRWMLVFRGTFAGLRRVRWHRSGRRIRVEHDHAHDHIAVVDGGTHNDDHAHDHAHEIDELPGLPVAQAELAATGAQVGPGSTGPFWRRLGHSHHRAHRHSHRHSHRHELTLPDHPAAGYGNGTATGIGMLHGVGVESPTQIAVFVASSAAAGAGFGLLLLLSWVTGLVLANSMLALLAGYGLLHAERNFFIYASLAVLVGVTSLVLGGLMIVGVDVLPEIDL